MPGFASTVSTSTCRRWSTPASAPTSIDYLRGKGWNVAGTPRADLFVSNGLQIPTPDNDDPLGEIIYVSGPLGG